MNAISKVQIKFMSVDQVKDMFKELGLTFDEKAPLKFMKKKLYDTLQEKGLISESAISDNPEPKETEKEPVEEPSVEVKQESNGPVVNTAVRLAIAKRIKGNVSSKGSSVAEALALRKGVLHKTPQSVSELLAERKAKLNK